MNTLRQPILLLSFTILVISHLQPIFTVGYPTTNDTDYIRTSCSATLYPDICYNSLSGYSSAVQNNPAQLARVAIGVCLSRARHMASYVSKLSGQTDYGSDRRAAAALHDCYANFGDAVDQIRGSLNQMRHLGEGGSGGGESLRFQMSNVQTWMSAALTNEDTCTDGFQDVPDGPVKADVCNRTANVKKFTSNALALVNRYVSQEIP